jgi:hypothetical protein
MLVFSMPKNRCQQIQCQQRFEDAAMPLTDTAIKKAKAVDKPRKLSDGEGLFLCVAPTGGKLWRMATDLTASVPFRPPFSQLAQTQFGRGFPLELPGFVSICPQRARLNS